MKRLTLITALLFAVDSMADDDRPYECMINKSKTPYDHIICFKNCENSKANIKMEGNTFVNNGAVAVTAKEKYSLEDFGPCEDKK